MTSEQLREKIQKAGWTIEEFADRIGKSPRTIYRWLNGQTPIPKLVKHIFK